MPFPRRSTVIVALAAAVVVGTGLLSGGHYRAVPFATSEGTQLVACSFAALMCWRRGGMERGWRAAAASCAFWAAATLIFVGGAVGGGDTGLESAETFLYCAAGVVAVVAVLQIVPLTRMQLLAVALDALGAAAGLVGVMWAGILEPAVQAGGGAMVVFPAADVIVGTAYLSFACSARSVHRSVLSLAAGLWILGAADLLYVHAFGHGGYVAGSSSDALWVVAFAVIGLGARSQSDVTIVGRQWRTVLPLVPLLALLPAAIVVQCARGALPAAIVFAGAAAGFAFSMRQLLLHAENQTLLREVGADRDRLVAAEERARLVVEYSGDGLIVVGADGRCVFMNEAAARLLDLRAEDAVGHRMHGIVHRRLRDGSPFPADDCALVHAVRSRTSLRVDVDWWTSGDEAFTPVAYVVHPLPATAVAQGMAAVVTFRDVTEQVQAAERLHRSEERWRALVQHSTDVVIVTDPTGHIEFVTESAQRVLGFPVLERYESNIVDFVHPDDVAAVSETFDRTLAGGPNTYQTVECRVRRASGEWIGVEAIASNLLHEPAVAGIVCNIRDVTDRLEAQHLLADQATHDALTGLANRSALYDAITERLRSASSAALLLMDLDGFKDVNDALGHSTGDQLLVAIAERLANATCADDVVARLGGDEFAVLLGGVADEADLLAVSKRIERSLARPLEVADWRLPIRASIGGAVVAASDGDAEALLQHADIAMYRAKHSHRDVAVYGVEDEEDRTRTLALASDLPDAIATGAVTAHYQPKVDLGTGRIVGVEALARWTHPLLGPVRPDVFVPLAEHNGLIVKLTEHMLDLAIAQATAWERDGFCVPVAVNVAPILLTDPELAGRILAKLAGAGLAPTRLTLEITEEGIADACEAALTTIRTLRDAGVRISIDDFGTGYSSLAYLKRLPVDELKIDRSFITELASSPNDARLVTTIIDLAHSFGLSVVAEGVEDEPSAAILRSARCELAQGFGLHRPGPAEHVTQALRSERRLLVVA